MPRKLSDFDLLRALADYLELGSAALAAEKSGISETSVRRAIRERGRLAGIVAGGEDGDLRASYQRRAEGIIAKCLGVLSDEDKLRDASVSQLTSAISSLKDSFIGASEEEIFEDPLSKSLAELGKGLVGDTPE